ncbi:MAG: anaerobic ribonucleoside-triphosphate reductase activating protein [Methanotrichaceae archaeon]|nr:anaerobic ribonucleoside-triphosphate reductase activating protein [Methanotrichaceae archaeon]
MKVNLGGIVHLSTVDWPGKACMVVFLRGCPLRCPHCQNRDLWEGTSPVDLSLIRNEMVKAKPFISAFVLSGGDPLMQPEPALALLESAKSLGLSAGLETSGCYPDRLFELLKKNVVDRVFLDIKTALKEPEYARATGMLDTGRRDVAHRVSESLRICMSFGVPLEIRTAVFPEMPSFTELREIAETLNVLKDEFPDNQLDAVVIQQGRPREREFEPVAWDELQAVAESIECIGDIDILVRAVPKAKLSKVDNPELLWPVDGRTSA